MNSGIKADAAGKRPNVYKDNDAPIASGSIRLRKTLDATIAALMAGIVLSLALPVSLAIVEQQEVGKRLQVPSSDAQAVRRAPVRKLTRTPMRSHDVT